MIKEYAETVKKLMPRVYSPVQKSDYGHDDWYVIIFKDNREFQIQSKNGFKFKIVQVGLGNDGTGFKVLHKKLHLIEVVRIVKVL